MTAGTPPTVWKEATGLGLAMPLEVPVVVEAQVSLATRKGSQPASRGHQRRQAVAASSFARLRVQNKRGFRSIG